MGVCENLCRASGTDTWNWLYCVTVGGMAVVGGLLCT